MSDSTDKKMLRAAAALLQGELSPRKRGTPIILCQKIRVDSTNTKGWRAVIGTLKGRGPRLELWFDHYARSKRRRFWFGFYSKNSEKLRFLTKNAPKYLKPIRTITGFDMEQVGDKEVWLLEAPLKAGEYNRPIFEKYDFDKLYYFGKFDPASENDKKSLRLVVRRAVAFFEDVGRTQPESKTADRDQTVYPRWENRRVVRQHISRERDSALAEERKIQDGYCCQICKMTFSKVYGDIGKEFAEAHHVVPLSRLKKEVQSSLADLITVCSNCHRMLHKLDGGMSDVPRLKRMLRKR